MDKTKMGKRKRLIIVKILQEKSISSPPKISNCNSCSWRKKAQLIKFTLKGRNYRAETTAQFGHKMEDRKIS
jgi:hypothetical protein